MKQQKLASTYLLNNSNDTITHHLSISLAAAGQIGKLTYSRCADYPVLAVEALFKFNKNIHYKYFVRSSSMEAHKNHGTFLWLGLDF